MINRKKYRNKLSNFFENPIFKREIMTKNSFLKVIRSINFFSQGFLAKQSILFSYG